jgi:hypothetical protein
MSSSFAGQDLFGSGPHRFGVGVQGELTVPSVAAGTLDSASQLAGAIELDVVVTGRLVAADEAGLWALRDAITDLLADPPTAGELIDHHGRTWAGMSFIDVRWADRTDRGRVVSIGYRALFRKLKAV